MIDSKKVILNTDFADCTDFLLFGSKKVKMLVDGLNIYFYDILTAIDVDDDLRSLKNDVYFFVCFIHGSRFVCHELPCLHLLEEYHKCLYFVMYFYGSFSQK